MTENKRFVYYEHKGADYILDTPNESLDFIEMLGDCLEAEEIVDLLNKQHEQIEDLKDVNIRCCNEYNYFHKRMIQLEKETEQLKQFKEKVFTLIEKELEEHPYLTLTEKWNPNCKNYHGCRGNHEKNVFYASRHTLLEKLRGKLSYD